MLWPGLVTIRSKRQKYHFFFVFGVWVIHMELRQLEYFVAAAELLSFSAAAERCCVVQSTISHQIANLEEELDVRLFERGGRAIGLTPAGELLLEESRALLGRAKEVQKKVRALGNKSERLLRVGYYSACIDPVFGARLHDFARACGAEVRLEYLDFYNGVFLERLHSGGFDCVITLRDVYEMLEQKEGICYEPLCRARVMLVVDPGHPLSRCGPVVSPEQMRRLCGRALIYAPSYSPSVCRRGILWNSGACGIPEERIETARNTVEMQIEIEAGKAVGLMLETELRSLNAGGRLVALNVEGAPCHEIGAAFRRADAKGLVGEFVRSMCSIETPVCKEEKRVV